MKNIIKFIAVFLLGVIVISCEDEDKNPLPVQEYENGAVLRTIRIISGSIDKFNIATSAWSAELEFFEDSDTDITLLESVDVFLRFRDNTAFNGTNDVAEILYTNIPGSSFQIGPTGLPRYTLSINAGDALNALGLMEN